MYSFQKLLNAFRGFNQLFVDVGFVRISDSICCVFFLGHGAILMIFVALEMGLKFNDFWWLPGGEQDWLAIEGRRWRSFWGPLTSQTASQQTACRDSFAADRMENTRIQECFITPAAWCTSKDRAGEAHRLNTFLSKFNTHVLMHGCLSYMYAPHQQVAANVDWVCMCVAL